MAARRERRRSPDGWLVSILLLGAALRIPLLTASRFHTDEALFATLGRLIVSGQDPLLTHTSLLVDKPPLFYYTLALLISICWGCELTARLVGLFSGLLAIALTARLTRNMTRTAADFRLAAFLVTVSPIAVLFSVTAFADPLLLMWLLCALVLATEDRSGWSGLCFGLALASKQNAIFFLPPLIGLLLIWRVRTPRESLENPGRFVLGMAVVVAFMFVWDTIRSPDTGFWQTGFARNNPGRLIRRSELVPRLLAWWSIIRTFQPGWLLTSTVLIAGLANSLWTPLHRPRRSTSVAALVLGIFVLAYLCFHWLVAFPLFDRYMLLLVPFVAVLAAPALNQFLTKLPFGRIAVVAFVIVSVVVYSMRPISDYGVGGDQGSNDGIDRVAEYLRDLPDGTIVYHQSLGWLMSYYLFDSYLVPVTIDSPAALTADLIAFADDPSGRFLVLSASDGQREMKRAITSAGYMYQTVLTTAGRQGHATFEVLALTVCCPPDL